MYELDGKELWDWYLLGSFGQVLGKGRCLESQSELVVEEGVFLALILAKFGV
jgi:hypothetical protein